ncbi:MAG TPA: hypothetical protein VHZ07_03890 [Bryobacteraceae bacterium]|jgi:hypothetical protein|nr:hypothetical protein [Bryobacteraceae bacterium]
MMNAIRSAWRELAGLFIEDWRFALAIAVWVVVGIFALPHLLAAVWRGPVFFLGVVAILVENVMRSPRP